MTRQLTKDRKLEHAVRTYEPTGKEDIQVPTDTDLSQDPQTEAEPLVTLSGRYHRLPRRITDDYIVEPKVLGKGCSGEVRLARSRQSSTGLFAVKTFNLQGISPEKREQLETEAEIFLAVDHPHVARLVDVYDSDDELSLVMECLTGGELFARVRKLKRFSEADAAVAAHQMLLAVNYIHSHGVVHRDIKLENFLYDYQGSSNLKLIDFGFSKVVQGDTKMDYCCGSMSYIAPEVITKSYTSQCDLWSLGVVVFVLLFGYMPFAAEKKEALCNIILRGDFEYKEDAWDRISESGQDFVRRLLVVNPKKRMTAQQALKHEWIIQHQRLEPIVDKGVVDALVNFGKASAFRRLCLSLMAWSLTSEEQSKVQDAFLAFDVGHNGAILLWEFKQTLKDKFNFDDQTIQQLFKALDLSRTHQIHYSDFLAAMVSSKIEVQDEHLQQTFRRFDVDGSGYITADGLKQVLGETFCGERIEKLMKEADLEDDGQISYQEWIFYLRYGASSDQSKVKSSFRIMKQKSAENMEVPFLFSTLGGTETRKSRQCCYVQ